MENISSYFYLEHVAQACDSSGDSYESDLSFVFGCAGDGAPSGCYSDSELLVSDLTATFQQLTIDVNGMVRELFERNTRGDTESIRQEFIRNGIDSSMTEPSGSGGGGSSKRFAPPGSRWPLSAAVDGNRSSDAVVDGGEDKPDEMGKKSDKNGSLSARRKRSTKENEDYCVFCYNNREEQRTYLGHSCRDEDGQVVCPKLRKYVCPFCQATGSQAHTKKYCPKKPIITPDDLQSMRVPPLDGGGGSGNGRKWGGKKALRF